MAFKTVQLMEKKQGERKKSLHRKKKGVGPVLFNHQCGKECMQRKQRLKQCEYKLTKHRTAYLKYLFRQSVP